MRRLVVFVVLVLVAAGCGGVTPVVVSERPNLESCQEGEVFIPIRQGPAGSEARSQAALDCFMKHHESGAPVELAFTLMGTEGDRFEAILQTLPGGKIDYFTNTDGWTIHQQCETVSVEPVPVVNGCPGTNVPDEDPAVAPGPGETTEDIFPAQPDLVESESAKRLAIATITSDDARANVEEIRQVAREEAGSSPSMIDEFSDIELLAYSYDLIERYDAGAGWDLIESEPPRLAGLGFGSENNADVVFFILEQSAAGLRTVALAAGSGVELDCDERVMFHGDPGPDTPAASSPQDAVQDAALDLPTGVVLEQISEFGTQTLWAVFNGDEPIALVTVGPWQSFDGVNGFLAGNVETCSRYLP
jgi:hypothetical protein